MRRTTLGALFFGWLYGVPFLLIVGLIRRYTLPTLATRAEAEHFAAVTDRYLSTAMGLNVAVPLLGLLVAVMLRDRYWRTHFLGALAGMLLFMAVYAMAATQSAAPLIGTVPPTLEPVPEVTVCIPTSGGHPCPGG
ncbi:hypothetical protein GCM10010112_16120 [Actinoplanes lobatus]|uniref:Uncharacterized protein n=1 Tax=Actinoplanes lobatus TaxID=113568 RepID=A0A7W7HNF4_9ACTN|nr:hypothetical protein [Actinoplanes lobatus]MBB4753442.1 hypothetical protein [Actinoplanes lobatus]GGN60167.1 hypothetical protein GCM10010112_16120 [Actinoplanes lobatus]GIE37974.1 hypothetical protein Alo02nite_08720 [Actinoplanes lobatus]